MLNLDFLGADVLTPDGLQNKRLSMAEGKLVDNPVGQTKDLSGYIILPGIVDVHGDGFERHVAPRRGAMKQMGEGLIAVEAELAANGITTGTLAQFISWEGGVRGPEFAAGVFTALAQVRPSLVTDLRGQVRFETHQLELYETLPERLAEWGINYIVFNDHLPHDRIASGKPLPQLTAQALRAGRSPEAHTELIRQLHHNRDEVPAALDWLVARLSKQGIRMGSHDDHTVEDRATWAKRGVQIAEFPETIEAAETAKAAGDPIILGAPNLVRGGSHKGNASALDLVTMGLCDALASDYHYPSPRRGALMLWQTGVLPLQDAWALVSSGPAQVLGLTDRGTLLPDQRADLVILRQNDLQVAGTIAGGKVSYLSGELANRFIA